MSGRSMMSLCLFFLLMTVAYGQDVETNSTDLDSPVTVASNGSVDEPSTGQPEEPTERKEGLCGLNDSDLIATVQGSFMVGDDLYVSSGNYFQRIKVNPFDSNIENLSKTELFPDLGPNFLTMVVFGGFDCDSDSGDPIESSGSGNSSEPIAPTSSNSTGSSDCKTAEDLHLLIFTADPFVSMMPYEFDPATRKFTRNSKPLPWGIFDARNLWQFFGVTNKPQIESGLFDKNQRRLYFFGTGANQEPAIFFKDYRKDAGFDKGDFDQMAAPDVYNGALMHDGNIYVMSNRTNGLNFYRLTIGDNATASASEPFINCDGDSPLKPEETSPPDTETKSTTPGKTGGDKPEKKGNTWIIILVIVLILIAVIVAVFCFFCMGKSEEKAEPKPEEAAQDSPGQAKPPSKELSVRSKSDSGSVKGKTGASATGSKTLAKPSSAASKKSSTDSKALAKRSSSSSSVRSGIGNEPSSVRSAISSKKSSKS